MNFGNVIVGSSPDSSLILRVANTGTCPLHLFTISIPPGFKHNFIENSIIQPNKILDITIYFSPDKSGIYSGVVTINSDATSGINSIVVLGQGLDTSVGGNGMLTVSGVLNFDTVKLNSVSTKTLNLTNVGTGTLLIDTIISSSDKFFISGISTPFSLDVNQSQSVNINFNTSEPGKYNGSIDVRANGNDKIINAMGVVVDSSGNVGCPTTFIDTRDGELYKAKMLAGKCWMTENLRYDEPNAGDDTPYADNSIYLNDYGRYYKWQTLMDGSPASNSNPSNVKGLCPNGWHVPSQAEIQDLLNYYGNDSILAFDNLKLGGTSGLDFRLGGSWVSYWFGFGAFGFYWTTSGNGGTASSILISQGTFQLSEQSVAFKIPCRCVKN
ncbi:MAG: FISUMP domain-containing protein [Bacteroidota bacterium]